jgi:hypothetical protein
LHAFTGKDDDFILTALGYAGGLAQNASCNITVYIQELVLSFANNLDDSTNNNGCELSALPSSQSSIFH